LKKCNQCGTQYEANATYCNHCDKDLPVKNSKKAKAKTQVSQNNTKTRRLGRVAYIARLSWAVIGFWLIYVVGLFISAEVNPFSSNWDFSKLNETETLDNFKFFAAIGFLIPFMFVTILQRLRDLGLSKLMITIVFCSMPTIIIGLAVIIFLGAIPGTEKANRYGRSPQDPSKLVIAYAALSPFLYFMTYKLATMIKASPTAF